MLTRTTIAAVLAAATLAACSPAVDPARTACADQLHYTDTPGVPNLTWCLAGYAQGVAGADRDQVGVDALEAGMDPIPVLHGYDAGLGAS